MRLRRHHQQSAESTHGIDLAPMLDFVLNLLIFFIITAVFVKEMALTVNRPSGVKSTDAGAGSIPITILEDGEIWVEGRVVDLRAVRANVERLHAVSPKNGVLIVAADRAKTGIVIEVVDQVKLGGIDDITFSTAQ